MALGAERERLEHETSINQQKIRALLQSAREADITMRDIARMTGLSTQTLHTWHRELMQPIPAVHYGLSGPRPAGLVEAVVRTMKRSLSANRPWTMSEPECLLAGRTDRRVKSSSGSVRSVGRSKCGRRRAATGPPHRRTRRGTGMRIVSAITGASAADHVRPSARRSVDSP